MNSETTLWQFVIIAVNILIAVAGFVISFMIHRLYKSIDSLAKKDAEIARIVAEHREDVLRNYSSNTSFNALKQEITGRLDRFEDNILAAIRKIP